MRSIYTFCRRLLPLTVAFCAALAMVGGTAAQELQEGKQYARIKNPLPVEPGKKIQVIEFFSYGCPHCADLEPEMQNWMKTVPADVQFVRVPVMFQDRWVA